VRPSIAARDFASSMAPILATATGITPQVNDEVELAVLKERLSKLGKPIVSIDAPTEAPPAELFEVLKSWNNWQFEDEVSIVQFSAVH
jgi:hypothetical protein